MNNIIDMPGIIKAVGEAFIVICAVAVGLFFTDGTVVDTDPAFGAKVCQNDGERKLWYGVGYVLALIIIVTLVLRFVIGSSIQLTQEYGKSVSLTSFPRFVTDVCFLMFFGAFLVAVAQAKTVHAFMRWLAIISACGVVWSLVALWRSNPDLAKWWLVGNSLQLVLTGILAWWCNESGSKRPIGGLIIAGVGFMIMFVFDLQKMLLNKIDIFGFSF